LPCAIQPRRFIATMASETPTPRNIVIIGTNS
jgi:hypothetical protein